MQMQSSPYPQQQWVASPQQAYQQGQQPYGYPQAPIQQLAPAQSPAQSTGVAQGSHRPGFDHVSQKRCGVLQLIFGCTVIAVSIVMIFIRAGLYQMGFGMWTSPFFIIAGGLGVQSAKSKNTCPIVGCMVMSIFGIFAAIVLFACGGAGLSQDNLFMFDNECNNMGTFRQNDYFMCTYFNKPDSYPQLYARMALNAFNIFAGVLLFFVALIQSVFCCKGTCCGGRKQQQQVIVYRPTPQAVAQPAQPQVPYTPQPVNYPPQQALMQQAPPYGGAMPMQGQGHPGPQYAMHSAPPPINPQYAPQAPEPSAPPSYDAVAGMHPKH